MPERFVQDDRIRRRYTVPVTVTVEESMAAEWCWCGFAIKDSGHGCGERVRQAFKAHECPLRPNRNGAGA